jgi:hypothetical protein
VARVCAELADVAISPDLALRIHADTGGRMRSVLNAISRVEITAQRLGKASLSGPDLAGVVLCDDYRAGLSALGRSKKGGAL